MLKIVKHTYQILISDFKSDRCITPKNNPEIIEKFTTGPSKIFGLEQGEIKEGTKANLTLFDPSLVWVFDKSNIKSKSKNTPFIGEKFTGKSLGVIC